MMGLPSTVGSFPKQRATWYELKEAIILSPSRLALDMGRGDQPDRGCWPLGQSSSTVRVQVITPTTCFHHSIRRGCMSQSPVCIGSCGGMP